MTSFYTTSAPGRAWWLDDVELNAFGSSAEEAPASASASRAPVAPQRHSEPWSAALAEPAHMSQTVGLSGGAIMPVVRGETPQTAPMRDSPSAGHSSFYGKKVNGQGPTFSAARPARAAAGSDRAENYSAAAGRDRTERYRAAEREEEEPSQPALPGNSVSVLPKRPPRPEGCRALDKDIAACNSPGEAFAVATRDVSAMDAANWANLIYALAHLKKQGSTGRADDDREARPQWLTKDPRWLQCCRALNACLADLTARDAANVLWSLATLACKEDPLFLDVADALRGKLAVCDPISISKAAWALTSVPNRDRRLDFFTHLAVPVVLRAEVFPLGALTMTCYAFAKAAHRDSNVYEALSIAISRYAHQDLRPIDVCNVVWAFCTVGYRDDHLFNRLCEEHLTNPIELSDFNPQDLTNTTWGFSKVIFKHIPAMDAIAREGLKQTGDFKPIHFTNFFYSFATMRLRGPEGFLSELANAATAKVATFDSANLSILVWSLAQLREHHGLLDASLRVILQPQVTKTLSSRTLSMLFLAFFRFGRAGDVDAVLDAALAQGVAIGASGFSAVLMTGEQGPGAERELRLQQVMADEAADDRMRATICNAAAIRLMKRGRSADAVRLLLDMRAAAPRCWTAVSSRLLSQLAPEEASALAGVGTKEIWERPVQSHLHPIAATRQNEGPHAYTREFMALQAALCGAPSGDVDACMQAVEQFAESRSLWLKITAWEKAVVVHEVARLNRPQLVLEIGAYIGYSAMNLARAVRAHGGRVASIEVDPVHVCIVRNMVEYAGLTDNVDVWTGYCYDVIPHILEKYGPRSIGMVFMDQKGTRFHTDLGLLEELDLLADGAVVLADNVLKPGAPMYIWHLATGPYHDCTAVSVREFLLQSEDWMVLGFHDASRSPAPEPPPELHRLAFESDAFRKRSMFDSVAPSKADWWSFSQRFVEGLAWSGCKPRIVGLHGRDNPVIQPEDVAAIFEHAGRELPPSS